MTKDRQGNKVISQNQTSSHAKSLCASSINEKSDLQDPFDDIVISAIADIIDRGGLGSLNLKTLNYHEAIQGDHKSLAQLAYLYPSKQILVDSFLRAIDLKMMVKAKKEVDLTMNEKDRLLEIMMIRFEVAESFKCALHDIYQEIGRNPKFAFQRKSHALTSMRIILECAHVPIRTGDFFTLQMYFLYIVYFKVAGKWFADDTADLHQTMSYLDKMLSHYFLKILHPEQLTKDFVCTVTSRMT